MKSRPSAVVAGLPTASMYDDSATNSISVKRNSSNASRSRTIFSRGSVDTVYTSRRPSRRSFGSITRNYSLSTDNKHNYIGKFPFLYSSEIYTEYRFHEKKYFDPYQSLTLIALFCFGIFTLVNLDTNGFCFKVSLALIIVDLGIYSLFIFLKKFNSFMKSSSSYSYRVAEKLRKSMLGRHIEDVLINLVSLLFGFLLYGRVRNEQCDPSIGYFSIFIHVLILSLVFLVHDSSA